MRGFDHASIISPSFHGLRKERLAQWSAFCVPKNDQKFCRGTSRKIGRGCAARFLKSLPYFRPNLWFSLPYFRPEALEPGAWPERITSCYGTYTVVGVNIKREMVLLPNDEEVANSSKKHTQFKTRVHKPYPISDQNGRNWYPISDQNGFKKIPFGASHTYIAYTRDYPSGRKTRCRLWVSLLAQARLIFFFFFFWKLSVPMENFKLHSWIGKTIGYCSRTKVKSPLILRTFYATWPRSLLLEGLLCWII